MAVPDRGEGWAVMASETTGAPARIVGILVFYSESYRDRALAEFRALLAGFGQPFVLLALSNNPDLDLSGAEGCRVLPGDNAVHEFTAWQAGLDHCRDQGLDRDARLYVLANDTFCHHRSFGGFEAWVFGSAFRRLLRRRAAAFAGETFGLAEPVRVDGRAIPAWVSTYLFALNRAGMERLGWQVAMPRAELDAYVAGGTEAGSFFTDRLSENLRRHLCGWLFEPETRPRWRRSAALDAANAGMMAAKARAIVSEKLLSARAAAAGVRIEGVYRPFRVRLLRRLRRWRAARRR